MNPKPSLRAVRGEILHFLSDPAVSGRGRGDLS